MFGLPTEKDLTKPEHMSEKDWELLFDSHMKRYDSFLNGILVGLLCLIALISFCRLITGR
jgi:hypothetical protein